MPIVDEKAPSEISFDSMVNELKNISPDTACVFNCQVGLARIMLNKLAKVKITQKVFSKYILCAMYGPTPVTAMWASYCN